MPSSRTGFSSRLPSCSIALAFRGLWLLSIVLDLAVTAWTVATYPIAGPRLAIAGVLGFVALLALLAVGVMQRQRRTVAAFAASSAGIVSLLGAAVATLYPYLIPSSSGYPGLTIFEASPSSGALAGIVAIVAIGLIVVYSYQIAVTRRLLAPSTPSAARAK
ncbi:MAG: cytochrome d ubiquinol oxidase subunit II [Candidatus Lustribacter sp.]